MNDVTGALRLTAGGKEYRLWMGTSVLAALQGLHGQDVLSQLDPPEDSPKGWMPSLSIVHDLFRLSLERYHGEVDRWTVDDLIGENEAAFAQLMTSAMPEPKAEGNGQPQAARRR